MDHWERKRHDQAMEYVRAFQLAALVDDDDDATLADTCIPDGNRSRWVAKAVKTGTDFITYRDAERLNGTQIRRRLAKAFAEEHATARVRLALWPYSLATFLFPDKTAVELFLYRLNIRMSDDEDSNGRPVPRSISVTFAGDSGSLMWIHTERENGRFANIWHNLERSIPLCSNRANAMDPDDMVGKDRELVNVSWLFGLEPQPVTVKTTYAIDFGVNSELAHSSERGPNGLMVEEI